MTRAPLTIQRVARHIFTPLALVFLVGCTPRPEIILIAETQSSIPVFVGTSRSPELAPEPELGPGLGSGSELGLGFDAERGDILQYARYDVAVPPNHMPGQIEWRGRRAGASENFGATRINRFAGPEGFRSDLRQTLFERPRGSRTAVLYVHGYNNTFADGVYRLAQLSHDFGLPDVAVHYSWPSAGRPLGYIYDRDSMLFARDGLEALLHEVQAAGAEHILLVGHSMGALLTMEVLRQMAIANDKEGLDALGGVVLISADIDVDVFKSQARRIGTLPQPFVVMTSTDDRPLRLSAWVTGLEDRIGTLPDAHAVSDFELTLINTSSFDQNLGHFNAASSPELISLLRHMQGVSESLAEGPTNRAGFFPGTALVVRNATQIILPHRVAP